MKYRSEQSAIVISLQRMICTSCGAEANASCNCGQPYVPAAKRVAEYDKTNPGKSTRQAAADLGVSKSEVSRARQSPVPNGTPETVTGRDGKTYPATRAPDTTNLLIGTVTNGVGDFSEEVDEWLLHDPSDEAKAALALAVSNAADVLAEIAENLNRGERQ